MSGGDKWNWIYLFSMTIYEHKTSLSTASGSVSSITLRIPGGLCRMIYVKANTSTTVFRVNLQDEDSDNILDYGFHTGMLVDTNLAVPLRGRNTLQITNASPDDTFKIKVRVEE